MQTVGQFSHGGCMEFAVEYQNIAWTKDVRGGIRTRTEEDGGPSRGRRPASFAKWPDCQTSRRRRAKPSAAKPKPRTAIVAGSGTDCVTVSRELLSKASAVN